ncbi:MAG: ASKHA domain-containing protein [bacterium]
MFKITFEPSKRGIEIDEKETILSAITKSSLFIPAGCGGLGTCGKCRVILEEGSVFPEAKKGDFILACQVKPKSELKIRIPEFSPILDKNVLKNGFLFQDPTLIQKFNLSPLIEKRYIELAPPTKDDNIDDVGRIKKGLGLDYEISFDCLKTISKELRKDNFKITATMRDKEIIRIEGGDREKSHYALSFDIGTTSVYGRLLDLRNKSVLAEASDYNKQIIYGDDVITRIIYSQKNDGLYALQSKVVETMEGIINELLYETKIEKDEISYIVCAGNTTMTHLLLGIDPKYIREEPYVPAFASSIPIEAESIGLKFSSSALLYTIPLVSSYIGGDITGGIVACGIAKSPLLTLYVDLGTNGEIVLGNSDFLLSASTSAGPAFEGGGIKCGMRAQRGAIDEIVIDRMGEPEITTIGGIKPRGICGAGIIEILAQMLFSGIINQKGKFSPKIENKRIREKEYVIANAFETLNNEELVITEADIDNIMRAKAAIFAGISVLLKTAGMKPNNIERVIIAGNLGSHIIPEKAIQIGLFPEIPLDRFHFFGNGSLIGATLMAFSKEIMEEIEKTANSITNIELSNSSDFMNEYIASLFIPHTEREKFPKTWEKIKELVFTSLR